MNENEKKAAATLLEKLQNAKPNETAIIATAYQSLMQGVLHRTAQKN